MKKKVSHAFGKDIYLLGADEEGINYWLEAPSWDCDWYWGFGYVKSYTNNKRPDLSRDVSCHQHIDTFHSKWFTEWNGSKPILKNKTFSDKEGWELSELFEQFYFLQKAAEYFGRGKAHYADTSIPLYQKPELAKEINEVRIPQVTARIIEILTPALNKSSEKAA